MMDLVQKAEDNFCLISIVFNAAFLFFAFLAITLDLPINLILDCLARQLFMMIR
jgi:hypothetical protein